MTESPLETSSIETESASVGINPVRLEKLAALREAGFDPFAPERFDRTNPLSEIGDRYEALEGKTVRVAGRISSKRGQGKVIFLDLRDESGRAQIYLKGEEIGETLYDALKSGLDIGDFLGIEGYVFKTKTGEPSVHAKKAVDSRQSPARRAVGQGVRGRRGRIGQTRRCRSAVSAALRGLNRQSGRPGRAFEADQNCAGGARVHGFGRFSGGGNAAFAD